MSSSNSSTPQRPDPSPPKSSSPSPSHSTAPAPDSSSPAPSRRPSDSSSPAPMASRSSHGAQSPAKSRSPRDQSSSTSRGSGGVDGAASARSVLAPAHRGGPTTLEIVFAAAGAAALLVILVAACVCCSRKTAPRRRKQRPHHDPMHYYADSSSSATATKGATTGSNSTYYPTGAQPQRQSDTSTAAAASSSDPPEGGGGLQWHAPPPDMNMTSGKSGKGGGTFSYEELSLATDNFAAANLLGRGGFGHVHRGVLPDGRAVAVKRLIIRRSDDRGGQGEREFRAEVDIIGRVHHRHLVSLVGHCVAGARRALVYQFVPNNTLAFHLHGEGEGEEGRPVMEWSTRLRVALGSAKGLAYLHEDCNPRIIHRDIKSANILLDDSFEAKVSDFGLASKLTASDDTHVSTRVVGTFGYLAPEYASSGKLTDKSDVFSYGVVLLELLTGRRPIADVDDDDCSLVDWARPALACALAGGDYEGVADPRMRGEYDPVEMARLAACAAAAVRHLAKKRPRMSQIVRALEGGISLEDLNLNDGVRPGQSRAFGTVTTASASFRAKAPGAYTADVERIRQAPMASPV